MKNLITSTIILASAFHALAQQAIPSVFVYTYDSSGCTVSRQDPNSMADYMSLTENSDTLDIKAYPQIVETILCVSITNSDNNSKSDATIFSIEGDKVYHSMITDPLTELNVSHLKNGIYILNVTVNENKKTFKFIKL